MGASSEDDDGDDVRRQLTLIGELFAIFIARREAEQARDRAQRELETLKAQIERERQALREEIRSESLVGEILGENSVKRGVETAIAKVAETEATVLIRGESRVVKELIARAIHERSARRDGPLVKVNCAAISRESFESEFFGHKCAGRFALADRGTLFLDEVGDTPLDLQAKLLRALQEGEFERLGEQRTRKANVRVIAATSRDLEGDIAEGRFRRDLYYRLNAFPIVVPSRQPLPVAMAVPMPSLQFKRLERENILAALEKTDWRVAGERGAAKLLGLAPSTLRDRMRALGIVR